jgi:hypothetical protein
MLHNITCVHSTAQTFIQIKLTRIKVTYHFTKLRKKVKSMGRRRTGSMEQCRDCAYWDSQFIKMISKLQNMDRNMSCLVSKCVEFSVSLPDLYLITVQNMNQLNV